MIEKFPSKELPIAPRLNDEVLYPHGLYIVTRVVFDMELYNPEVHVEMRLCEER